MSQFRRTGQILDDPIGDDGDRYFASINQRLQINQLSTGEVRESLNGRMDGFWKPRKATIVKSSGLASGVGALRIPFYLFPASTTKAISAASLASGVVSLTVIAHGFPLSSTGWINVAGIAGYSGTTPNGLFLVTVVDANSLSYLLVGGSGTYTVNGSSLISSALINDSATSDIYGSCLFSDPASQNQESILVATNTDIKKINLDDFSHTTITLPSGQTIDGNVDMIQCFNKVVIFIEGKQALEWSGISGENFLKCPAGVYVQPSVLNSASTVVSKGVVSVRVGATGTYALSGSGLYTDNGATDTIVFPDKDIYGVSFSSVNDFYKGCGISINGHAVTIISAYDGTTKTATFPTQDKPSGVTQSFVFEANTASDNGPHNINVGDIVNISDSNSLLGLNNGDIFTVSTVPSAFTFTFFADVPDHASHTITLGQTQSLGLGYMANPGAPWGTYFQRRLFVPYWYDQTGTYASPTYIDKKERDQIAVSDISDNNTFDSIYAQFRIAGGTADFTVGMYPFYNDSMVVLNRNSLHLISSTSGSLNDVVVKELTSELGCLARKSVIMQGNILLFLSDNGVYGLEFIDLYNLRGIGQPISMMIQPYIDRINKDLADKSVGVYHDNRYWLAVPLDGDTLAVGNNTILVYNFLNKGWESIDTYSDSRFNIMDFHVAKSGVRNDLYAITSNGGLHKLNDSDIDFDTVSVDTSSSSNLTLPVSSSLTTRGYNMSGLARTRWTDAQIQIQALDSDNNASYDVSFSAEDPDASTYLGNTYDMVGEILKQSDTANVRTRIGGIRGFTGTMILKRTSGSPKINSVKVSGALTNRSIISQN